MTSDATPKRSWLERNGDVFWRLFVVGLLDGRPPPRLQARPTTGTAEQDLRAKLDRDLAGVEALLRLAQEAVTRLETEHLALERDGQTDWLWQLFRRTAGYLLLVAIGATVAVVTLFNVPPGSMTWPRQAGVALSSGALGSAIAALLSAADRVAGGWELESGEKCPPGVTGETFNARMVPLFVVRPFLGAIVGLIAYAGLRSGLLGGQLEFTNGGSEKLLFLLLLSGFFAKTLLDKLKDVFKALLGQ